MAKVIRCTDNNGTDRGWMVFCPACQCGHRFDLRWRFDGNMERPTFHPSLLIEGYVTNAQGKDVPIRCHSFVQDGHFHYCHDSTHNMRDKVVPIGDM